jgi:hypothetical protein
MGSEGVENFIFHLIICGNGSTGVRTKEASEPCPAFRKVTLKGELYRQIVGIGPFLSIQRWLTGDESCCFEVDAIRKSVRCPLHAWYRAACGRSFCAFRYIQSTVELFIILKSRCSE